jgi:hypothetical protein
MRPAHPIRGKKESIFNTEKQGEGTEAAEKQELWRCAQWVSVNVCKGWLGDGPFAGELSRKRTFRPAEN